MDAFTSMGSWFSQQHLDEQSQAAVARRFGEVQGDRGPGEYRPGSISNYENGQLLVDTDFNWLTRNYTTLCWCHQGALFCLMVAFPGVFDQKSVEFT
jgi:hypothetical protein